MASETRRKYPRIRRHISILYAGYDSECYYNAMMLNSCPEGMYFKSDAPVQPECDLFIKINDHRRGSGMPAQYKAFRAKVKWCHKVMGDKVPCYGIGVQYTAKSHLLYGTNCSNSDCLCDYCENRSPTKLIHLTETGLQLCPSCLQHIEALPRSVEESVERFLLGNVV